MLPQAADDGVPDLLHPGLFPLRAALRPPRGGEVLGHDRLQGAGGGQLRWGCTAIVVMPLLTDLNCQAIILRKC